ncbi:uncharacterized protein LOC107410385 [Ziziphus jujuba]|uniref:Uncharacterized protein LOC107410385 n=2 Tax=Ziziphus jujuba TaxID=326968 RepID=A0A6P3ZI10_ZIZJJ|nr:uncharacterized protein LOC107410385 [Ziziphus jujuba]XP_048324267.1 uncharacterized protein LOC107410385 [Ziziphus jujuba var. spinosa]
MGLESDFGSSLFENLKLEDPWLPPSSWESLPSESGPRLSHRNLSSTSLSSSSTRFLHNASSVSEGSLVRLAMNALQGVQSSLISIEKLSAAFCSDPADRTFHEIPSLWNRSSSTNAQGKILKSIGCSGFLVFLLCKFVDYFSNPNFDKSSGGMRQHECLKPVETQNHREGEVNPPYTLVNHAFSVAVGKVIEGYICALDTLYASVHLRHSSESSDLPLQASSSVGCLTTVVYSEITLLELYLHTKELRAQIEALGNICNLYNIALCFSESSSEDLIAKASLEFDNFCRGGDLLTYLYTQLQVADPPHCAMLKFLFLRSFEPYCGFIRSWMFKAELNDPYKEFIVEYFDNLQPSQHGKTGISMDFPLASVRERDGVSIPCFLKEFLVPLVRAGQQLQVLMKLLELCTYVAFGDHTYEDFLPGWSGFSSNLPFTFSKENIEAIVLVRDNYYKMMQEKLENLLTKLEFRYQQVVSHDILPNAFSSGERSSTTLVSFKSGESLIDPLTENLRESNVADDNIDADDSSTMDDLPYVVDNYESSECSSSDITEEPVMTEKQQIELSNHRAGLEQEFFPALSFSVSPSFEKSLERSHECKNSYLLESDSGGICEKMDAICHYVQSHQSEMVLNPISLGLESQESDWTSVSGNQYTDHLPDNNCPVTGFLKNSDIVGYGSRSHPEISGMGSLKEDISYYSKMIVNNNALMEEAFGKDQYGNSTSTSGSFMLQQWKLHSPYNFLSMNPTLAKSSFLKLLANPGERDSKDYRFSLPCFDFSSVEDPWKVCLEKFSAGFVDSSASATSTKVDHHDQEHCDNDDVLIGETTTKFDDNSLSDMKEHNHEYSNLALASGGSSWESLLDRPSNIMFNSDEDQRLDFLSKFEIPLDFIIDKCLLQEIMLQYKYVSRLTIRLLEEGFDLQEHFLALRRYHFLELADWADLFIMSLWHHKWCSTEANQRLSEIQGFLELSVQRSSCEFDRNKDRLYLYLKHDDAIPLSTSVIGIHSFDFVGLGYRVDWPVNIVLTPDALKIYTEIFSFLIQVRLAVFSLTDIWCSFKELVHLISQNRHSQNHELELGHFNLLMKIRHQVSHFVSTLQQYVESQLLHVSWCRFLHSLQHKVKDMMDIESVHMAYLTDSLHICFLSDETRPIANIIESILQCALDFRSCLRGSMWDIGMGKEDFSQRLSRINISQVLAIKKTFDKNLQELHLYHLKSPKHGKFGISRFWEYLNYNEYYSNVVNQMGYHAFSI